MKTSGGLGNLPDGEAEDVVKTEAQAIQIAEAFLKYRDEAWVQHLKNVSEQRGDPSIYEEFAASYPTIFTLHKIYTHTKGWVIDYWRSFSGGGTIDPPLVTVTVNKKTGEARFNSFSDDE